MNIWRLISFHEADLKQNVTQGFIDQGRIAIGWGDIGELNKYGSKSEIGEAIRKHYPNLQNANIGGPSLWHLYANMQIGDLIIIDAQKRWAKVVEVIGSYEWNNVQPSVANYYHQRRIKYRSDIDPNQLLNITSTRPAPGQSAQLVLFYYGSFVQALQSGE